MYEKIKKLISDKNNNLDNQTLMYFTNYFYVLVKDGLIPNGITLEDLIDNAIRYASKVEFYDEIIECIWKMDQIQRDWEIQIQKQYIYEAI